MEMKTLLLFLSCHLAVSVAHDDGFLYWFTSNTKECQDQPIFFDNPLPSWIHGTLVHNGPGQFEMGTQSFGHPFDGYAKIASWKFDGNKTVLFTTKFVRSKYYESSVNENKITPYFTFGPTKPTKSAIEKIESVKNQMDNMNVNIYNFSGSSDTISAVNDIWNLYQMNLSSLETVQLITPEIPPMKKTGAMEPKDVSSGPIGGNKQFIKMLYPDEIGHLQVDEFGRVNAMSSAHPVPEYGKDSHLTFLSSVSILPGVKNVISLIRVNSVDVREIVAQIEVDEIPYMHSFGVTPNYAVMFGQPFFIDYTDIMNYGYVMGAMKWDSTKKSKIYVIDLSTGKTISLETEANLILHFANAFEDGNTIVFDAPVYAGVGAFKEMTFENLKNETIRRKKYDNVTLSRYVIDLKSLSVKISTFIDKDNGTFSLSRLTFPTFNENYRFKNYCLLYGVNFNVDRQDYANTALVKVDLCNRGRDSVIYIPNHYPSEAWFVPAPSFLSKDEDDGFLMSVFLDGETKKSYLALIDAKSFKITHKA